MITITVSRQDPLCGECGQPQRNCKCFTAGRPRQRNRLEKLEQELNQLAREHPEVLGERFTSKAKGKERRFLLSIRKRYRAVLRQLLEVRLCILAEATVEKSLSPDVVKQVRDVTQGSAGKSH